MVSDTHPVEVCFFTDSDWMGSAVDQKSTSGYWFSLGSAMISWSSRKQGSVAQSTAEAEYIAASAAGREAVWPFSDLFRSKLEPTAIYCDDQSCIKLTKNPVFHWNTLRWDISISGTWFKVKFSALSMFGQQNRQQTFSPSHCPWQSLHTFVTSLV
jgi:hypothetical protein